MTMIRYIAMVPVHRVERIVPDGDVPGSLPDDIVSADGYDVIDTASWRSWRCACGKMYTTEAFAMAHVARARVEGTREREHDNPGCDWLPGDTPPSPSTNLPPTLPTKWLEVDLDDLIAHDADNQARYEHADRMMQKYATKVAELKPLVDTTRPPTPLKITNTNLADLVTAVFLWNDVGCSRLVGCGAVAAHLTTGRHDPECLVYLAETRIRNVCSRFKPDDIADVQDAMRMRPVVTAACTYVNAMCAAINRGALIDAVVDYQNPQARSVRGDPSWDQVGVVVGGVFVCRTCRVTHTRGPIDGDRVYRCLRCGNSGRAAVAPGGAPP